MSLVAVVIPSVTGREHHLERCLRAYAATTSGELEIILEMDHETCGLGWNAGAARALSLAERPEFLHFSSDDLEPQPGWLEAAVETARGGANPAPLVLQPNGAVESCGIWGAMIPNCTEVPMSVVPFMLLDDWERIGPIPPIHYYSDNVVSILLQTRCGRRQLAVHGYRFVHYWAMEKRRPGGDAQARRERGLFEYLKAKELEACAS